ncbi:MAG: hypothetical protein KatS3mg108_3214 [Isosphaeraceae bacterium]|jgi:hypothetical protein|nr:MAG: hypothetical protein KatS3mg108_3214 [Isosphaeraceae bacterium]
MSATQTRFEIPFQPTTEITEVSLLLSTRRLEALMAISRQRGQTVGQFLRHLIDQALEEQTPAQS